DAGHDLTLGQMPVAYQSPAAIIGELIGMAAEQARNLGLDRLRQKRSRAVAQNLGQRIAKSSWLRELENISVGHGVSLLRWRSGGVEHPHDTPPYPFLPSPTFAHSSDLSPTSGPALTLTGLIPDQHHYHGRGGRAYPLWLDSSTAQSNIKPALLTHLAQAYGQPVGAEEVMAYLAAVLAHP